MGLTLESLKLCWVESDNRFRHSGGSSDAAGVDGPHTEVIRVSFEQALHGIFADLHGGVITLHPVLCSDLTSAQEV